MEPAPGAPAPPHLPPAVPPGPNPLLLAADPPLTGRAAERRPRGSGWGRRGPRRAGFLTRTGFLKLDPSPPAASLRGARLRAHLPPPAAPPAARQSGLRRAAPGQETAFSPLAPGGRTRPSPGSPHYPETLCLSIRKKMGFYLFIIHPTIVGPWADTKKKNGRKGRGGPPTF